MEIKDSPNIGAQCIRREWFTHIRILALLSPAHSFQTSVRPWHLACCYICVNFHIKYSRIGGPTECRPRTMMEALLTASPKPFKSVFDWKEKRNSEKVSEWSQIYSPAWNMFIHGYVFLIACHVQQCHVQYPLQKRIFLHPLLSLLMTCKTREWSASGQYLVLIQQFCETQTLGWSPLEDENGWIYRTRQKSACKSRETCAHIDNL